MPAVQTERALGSASLAEHTREFVRVEVLDLDDEFDGDITAAGGDNLRLRLQAKAREAGVYGPQIPVEYGGHGLNLSDRTPVFEEVGYSLFGPTAVHAAAPDEGNLHLLDVVASADQRERFLAPLARGEVRSAFAMTEPAPGAGSDPTLLNTQAQRVSGGWRLTGRKAFITGADGAAFLIVMARTSGEAGSPGGATLFLAPTHLPGLEVGRHIPTMDRSMLGGHCEIRFADG